MDYLQAALLGLIQALTEFLPVSSSAHLLVVPWLFEWRALGLFFDVALHWGTALAVLIFFRKDCWDMFLSPWRAVGRSSDRQSAQAFRRLLVLFIGTVPAVVVGFGAKKIIEQDLRQPWIAAFCLAFFAVVLVVSDRWSPKSRQWDDIGYLDGVWIGLAQTLALVPGVSRSGITLTAGRIRSLERPDAARFSFLLSLPAILGAAVLETWEYWKAPASQSSVLGPALLGMAVAAVAGFACLHCFLRFLRWAGLEAFAVYRFILAAVIWFKYHS
jgi:undecaprenyl-diphosphatase